MGVPDTTNAGFQFITSINTVARDDETRRKVRSHARRQKLPNQPSPPQSKKPVTQKERTSKFRFKPASAQSSNKPNDVPRLGVDGDQAVDVESRFDTVMVTKDLALTVAKELPTFSTLRIETTPLTENLMKWCFTVCLSPRESFVQKWFNRAGAPTYFNTYYSGFLANAFAMNPTGNWFDTIQIDAAASHAFLATIAAMHNSLAMWDDTSTFDFHRFRAVKSVNERLKLEGKDDKTPVSDGVVVAVSLLVNNEAHTGSLDAAAAHMSGLKRMVDLRGGIVEGFRQISVLQRAIAWADFSYATAAAQPLLLPFIPELASSLPMHDRFQSRSALATKNSVGRKDLVINDHEALGLLELLFAVANCLNSFDYTNIEAMSLERVQVSDSVYLAEWRLCKYEEALRSRQALKREEPVPLLISEIEEQDSREQTPVDISDAVIHASHLFLHLALRGQPPAAPRHRALLEALMASLCDALLGLDLLACPMTHGSPGSYHSAGNITHSSPITVDSWATTNTDTSCINVPEAEATATTEASKDDLHSNILLWALFMGTRVLIPLESSFAYQDILLGDHHKLFIKAFYNYCQIRSITTKDALATKLKDVMWLDTWCEHQLDLVWAEIGNYLSSS